MSSEDRNHQVEVAVEMAELLTVRNHWAGDAVSADAVSRTVATGRVIDVSDFPRDRPVTEPLPADRPPWWLITSWGRWVASVAYPILLSIGPITRLRDGRSNALDVLLLIFLTGLLLSGLLMLTMTLLAYRRDPSLRNRKWPTPPPSPGLSRKVKRYVAFLAIAALGLVLLIYAGWGAALFVTVILGGVAIAIDRFDLFTDDVPTAEPAGEISESDRDVASGDRWSDR